MVKNFVRVIPKKGGEKWPSKLGEMSNLFGQAEYEMVKQGYRKAAIIHIDEHNYQQMTEKMNKDGLIFTPFLKSGHYEGFSHCHKEVKPGEPYYWYGCLTKTYKDAQEFKRADGTVNGKNTDHKKYGEMLGYPECCSSYFIKAFPKNYDPIWLEKQGEVSGYPECNQMLRYFGARITSHFSCSSTCKKTREIGQKWLSVMKGIDKKLTEELYDLLNSPCTWNSYHGVVQVETPYFIGLTHTFPLLKKPRIINWNKKRII